MKFLRNNMGPLSLIVVCPPAAILFWYTAVNLNGSFQALFNLFIKKGVISTIFSIWSPVFFGSKEAWMIISVFALFQLALMKLLPGKKVFGPVTKTGYSPEYKENGPLSFFVTLITYITCSVGLNWFSPTIIYDHFGQILGALCFFSFLFCFFLYFKGRYYPSTKDHSHTGNFIFDYYWGTELYPSILGWNIKQFTNCRFGMMAWPLICISFAFAQAKYFTLSNSMLVSVGLQLIYVTKFFFWEKGYLRSLDIMHDRAGFYICWGCLVWVPSVYTSPALYLVNHSNQLNPYIATTIFALGAIFILMNYFADRQRQLFREKNGDILIFGKKPNYTKATYKTEDGVERQSLLLASGFWGVARHFHYIPELLGALFWALPALFVSFYPYFYFCFLCILLFDRAVRDDERCLKKYNEGWKEHCRKVPYKIIPLIY
jgi:7-dehydrocholesterol reductase